jgi:UDP-N-acetylmuramoyl-L-alanyl-D-glutamate--2,6-diaminopimelate ligase
VKISVLATELSARGVRCTRVGAGDPAVCGVTSDSRFVAHGDLFIALPGAKTDGSRFVSDALRAGAHAVACKPGVTLPAGVPGLVVDDPARACGQLAAVVYGDPARRLTLVGVTGTNGKTSCTYLLESMWSAAGEPAGVIGTVSIRWPGHEEKAAMTTPDAPLLQSKLRAMVEAGCTCAAIEVSSHALSQYRVEGCEFNGAIFTNLTRDHLDYHGDEETYFSAKAALFLDHLRADGVAVLNADDPYAMRLANRLPGKRIRTFSIRPNADAWAVPLDVRCELNGLRGRIRLGEETLRVETMLIGLPNLANVLAAAALARSLGVPVDAVEGGIRARPPVPGRLERVGRGTPVVLVDYAHTPDALERTLATTREMTRGRLIVVFGCGGDRDRGKRPIMGRAAATAADVCVLTSDNPRSEDPLDILRSIEEGFQGRATKCSVHELSEPGASGYAVEPDRERAIAAALALAQAADVVVIAGKGHEDYQEVAGVRRAFDDRQVVQRLQAARGQA